MPIVRLLPPLLKSLRLNALCLNYKRTDLSSLSNQTYRKYHLHNGKLFEGNNQSNRTRLYVRRFLRACEKDGFDQAASKHKQKLCRLGLNWQNIENSLNVVTNLSSKKLGNCEIDLHNKGLDFGILPGKFCKYEQILKSFTRNVVRFFNNNTELNLRVF